MHIVVIGGTGHIGTYLCPALLVAGHQVTSITRGERKPYTPNPLWTHVTSVVLDRTAEEQRGNFGNRIAALQPDVVVDITCYTLESAQQLTDALAGNIQHFLHCGTIWIYGPSVEVPATEDTPRRPFGDYGCRKLAIEEFLLGRFRSAAFPATMIHPGHIVGPGWAPINPSGNFNVQVFSQLAAGEELLLPNFGMETLHHVHASDVAQSFARAIAHPEASIGESFHAVSSQAITMRGYAEAMSAWFGKPPRLRFLPWEEWKATVSENDARMTWDHMAHSPNASIAKAQRLLEYEPRYSSLAAVQESVQWLMNDGRVQTV